MNQDVSLPSFSFPIKLSLSLLSCPSLSLSFSSQLHHGCPGAPRPTGSSFRTGSNSRRPSIAAKRSSRPCIRSFPCGRLPAVVTPATTAFRNANSDSLPSALHHAGPRRSSLPPMASPPDGKQLEPSPTPGFMPHRAHPGPPLRLLAMAATSVSPAMSSPS